MSASRAREIFFPYLYGDIGFRLDLTESAIDGKRAQLSWNAETSECDLSSNKDWKSARLVFAITAAGAVLLPELVPSAERKRLPIRVIASIHCRKTYKRRVSQGVFDAKSGTGKIECNIERSDVADSVELQAFAVRDSAQSADKQYASDANARLMTSQPVTLRVDETKNRPGPGLHIEWESFSKSQNKYRAANGRALFHLDTDGPTLFLNKDSDPDLQAILGEDAPKGRKAALRNVLFSAIAMPIWMSLIRTSLHEVNEDGSIEDGWQRKVLIQFARAAEPQCDDNEALRRIIADLRDSGGGHAIEQRLPVIIASMVQFRERAEQTTKVLL